MLDLSFAAQSSALGAQVPTSTLGNVVWRTSSASARGTSSAETAKIAGKIAETVRIVRICMPPVQTSDDFLGLVVGLAIAAQGRRPGAGVERVEARRDLGVLALEQRIAGKIALDQERAEFFHVEHPDRLRQAEFLQPIDAGNAFDAAAEQCAGA